MALPRDIYLAGFVSVLAVLYTTSSGDAFLDARPSDFEEPDVKVKVQSPAGSIAQERNGTGHKPLIAVVGLSRTGTSSVAAALTHLNMTVYHTNATVRKHLGFWYYYLSGRISRPSLPKLFKGTQVDAVADCWYAILAPEILKAYPDTKFILTTRDVDEWLMSYEAYMETSSLYHQWRQTPRLLLSAISRTLRLGRLLRAAGLLVDSEGFSLELLPHLMYVWHRSDEVLYGDANPGGAKAHWAAAYEKHAAWVRSAVPPDQLLELDVSKGHGWKQLTDFLGVPTAELADLPFPHKFARGVTAVSGGSSSSEAETWMHEILVVVVLLGVLLGPILHHCDLASTYVRPPAELVYDADGLGYTMHGPAHERKEPSKLQTLLSALADLRLRLHVWRRLHSEHAAMCQVYAQHCKEGYFDYGEPGDYNELLSHKATKELLSFRGWRTGKRGPCENGHDRAVAPGQGFHSKLRFLDDGSVLPTYLSVDHGAGAAAGALGLACADLFELRTSVAQEVLVPRRDAGMVTTGYLFVKVAPQGEYEGLDGFAATIEQEGKVNPVRKAYTAADGHAVFLHGGFPKLKQGILDFLGGVQPDVAAIAAEVAKWQSGAALEAAMQAKGLSVTLCRTPREWRASEQGRAVLSSPVIHLDVRKVSGGLGCPPVRLLPTGLSVTRPLSDVLVLDFSHVIASPVVGRCLLEHGATVVKLVTHARPRRHGFDEEANAGKLTCELDLESEAGKAHLWSLLRAADVLIDGYTNGVLARHGFAINDVLASCPHLVYCQVSCYGCSGPFAGRKGFQQNANFCTGVSGLEDEKLLGYQLTSQTDYATGILGAYAIVLALTQRQLAAEAGEMLQGILVRVSLCATATWMSQYGAYCPSYIEYVGRITRLIFGNSHRLVTAGNVSYLQAPERMTATPPVRVPGFSRWWRDAKEYKL